jgi:hypothetical protein
MGRPDEVGPWLRHGEVTVRHRGARTTGDETGATPTAGEPGAPRPRALTLALAVAAAVVLIAAACTGDDDSSGGSGSGDGNGSGDGEAADQLDPERLESEIIALLADYDDVVNQIIADPQVAEDADGALVDRYLDLFEPDSEFADQALETWRSNAAGDISIEPYDDAHPANLTRLDGEIEVVSDDEVRFPTCSEFRQRVYEGDRVIEGLPFMEQPGRSTVVLIDDEWVFRRRDVFTDVPECTTDNPDETQADSPTGSQTDGPAEGS